MPARAKARARALAVAGLAVAGLALAGLTSGCGPTLIDTCQTKADCASSKPYCSAQGVCIAQSGVCTPACTPPGYVCSTGVCVAVKPSIEEPRPAGVSPEPRPGSP